jgi:hypothetical protein
MSFRIPALLVALVASVLVAFAAPPGAEAAGPYATGILGVRMTICARDIAVRYIPREPGFADLYRGQTFYVHSFSPSREWVYGFAYGHVNRWGYVQNGWFC